MIGRQYYQPRRFCLLNSIPEHPVKPQTITAEPTVATLPDSDSHRLALAVSNIDTRSLLVLASPGILT